ncbi:hypothetical protein [Geobacter argillaceus]|nr:hypothetical protein [Geobacter argillaceus]
MNQPDKVTLRLLRQNNRLDVVLSDSTFDIVQKLAAGLGVDAALYLKSVITDHICLNASKVLPPPPVPAWVNR